MNMSNEILCYAASLHQQLLPSLTNLGLVYAGHGAITSKDCDFYISAKWGKATRWFFHHPQKCFLIELTLHEHIDEEGALYRHWSGQLHFELAEWHTPDYRKIFIFCVPQTPRDTEYYASEFDSEVSKAQALRLYHKNFRYLGSSQQYKLFQQDFESNTQYGYTDKEIPIKDLVDGIAYMLEQSLPLLQTMPFSDLDLWHPAYVFEKGYDVFWKQFDYKRLRALAKRLSLPKP